MNFYFDTSSFNRIINELANKSLSQMQKELSMYTFTVNEADALQSGKEFIDKCAKFKPNDSFDKVSRAFALYFLIKRCEYNSTRK